MSEFSLSSLDSINQIGIAFLLAYLNLERYRYRNTSLKLVKDKLKHVITNSGVSDIKEYDAYKKLVSFSSKLESLNSNFLFKNIKELPVNFFDKALLAYFSSNLDRNLTILFYILLAFNLVVATNYYSGAYKFLSEYLVGVFYLTIIFSAFPLLNIIFGIWMQKRLLRIVDGYNEDIDKTIKTIKQVNKGAIEETSPDNLTRPK